VRLPYGLISRRSCASYLALPCLRGAEGNHHGTSDELAAVGAKRRCCRSRCRLSTAFNHRAARSGTSFSCRWSRLGRPCSRARRQSIVRPVMMPAPLTRRRPPRIRSR
jgi:hypothetical protein